MMPFAAPISIDISNLQFLLPYINIAKNHSFFLRLFGSIACFVKRLEQKDFRGAFRSWLWGPAEPSEGGGGIEKVSLLILGFSFYCY